MHPESLPLVLFLSPHFDDIALSCGGTAARLSRTGARCLCITVAAAPAPPGGQLSTFAQQMHTAWQRASGKRNETINDTRREEERQALRLLGLEPVWLDMPDAPYRNSSTGQPLYTSDEALFGKLAPEEKRTLAPWIATEIRRVAKESGARGKVRVFAPLGVGRHVDHQIVFWAARHLGPRFGVLFYEDYPYAAKRGALEERIAELGVAVQPRVTSISDLIGVKIAAIARYKSQMELLFGSSEAMPNAVRAYAHFVAAATPTMQYAERVWHIPPSYMVG